MKKVVKTSLSFILFSLVAFNLASAQSCTQLSGTTAILRGQITSNGGDPNMTVWFEWRRQGDLFWNSTPSRNVIVNSVPYTFSETLSGLNRCTTYEYRAVARNSAGTSRGSIMCFRTNCTPPLQVTCSASPNPASVGQTVTFTANVTGGTGIYSYLWSGACSGSSSSCTTSFNSVGTYTAQLRVQDSEGNIATTQCSVTVQAGLPQVITLPPVETL